MNKLLLAIYIVLMSWSINAQDERYLRQIFSGELNKEKEIAARKYSYVIHTPYYALDLNGNNLFEYIVFVKKDSEDWIEILDENKLKIFSYKFEAKGFDSELYRVELKRLGPQVSILLLYYYEGISRYLNFQGTSRVYAITIDNQDLKTLKAFKGTVYFDETKNMKGHYHKRNYQVFLEDLNNDSVKELIIKYRRMTDVFLYKGEGKWQTFNQNQ